MSPPVPPRGKRKAATSQDAAPPFEPRPKRGRIDAPVHEPCASTGASDARATPSGSASDPLLELLDFTDVEGAEETKERFDEISKALLHDYLLVVTRADGSATRLQVMEHEFYLQKEACHEDPFAHASVEQSVMGRWYFHRAPRPSKDSNRSLTSSTAYRGGTRKGMDLTFGRPAGKAESLLRGGILLRSARVLGEKPKVVSGPSLLVDQILSLSGASSIPELVQDKWGGNITAFAPPADTPKSTGVSLRIVSKASLGISSASSALKKVSPATPTIYTSPRIGLDLSHPGTTSPKTKPLHSRIQFLPRLYRYFVHPNMLVANGRSQTFLGLLFHFAFDPDQLAFDKALNDTKLFTYICTASGLKEPTAKKYLAAFKVGREGGEEALERFVGPRGKGAGSSPALYLEMMGAISKTIQTV